MDQLVEIFVGQATALQAHLYIRTCRAAIDGVLGIAGTLTGPKSRHSRTLQANYSVRKMGAGTDRLAEVMVTDPCFWTPEQPFLYRLDLEIRDRDHAVHRFARLVGIRRWAVDRSDLRLDGRRTVLRGMVVPRHVDAGDLLPAARKAEVALVVSRPDDALCEEASQLGVALVADLRGEEDVATLTQSLLQAGCWPAVMLALLDSAPHAERSPDEPPLAGMSTGMIVAQSVSPTCADSVAAMASGGGGLVVELGEGERPPVWLADQKQPAIAICRRQSYADPLSARAACDRLQAELAPQFDLAGYFV